MTGTGNVSIERTGHPCQAVGFVFMSVIFSKSFNHLSSLGSSFCRTSWSSVSGGDIDSL